MKNIFLFTTISSILLSCGEIQVDPSKKVGEENGKAIYVVGTSSIDVPRSRYAIAEEKQIILAYCGEQGGRIISTNIKSTSPMQKPLPGGGMYTTKVYAYDLKFICNSIKTTP